MRAIAEGIHVHETPQRFLGLEVGARMTVMQLHGGLLVHSPVALPPSAVADLGPLRWVLAPNKLHHLHAGPWIDAGAEACCGRGLPEKRPDLSFDRVIEEEGEPFGDQVLAVPMRCFPFANEVVLLHRPSRTLVVTDLLFHLQPTDPWLTRLAFRCLCAYPGCRTSLLERVAMQRDVARREIDRLLDLDSDRVVMAHGAVLETGGKRALAEAFAWLSGRP